MANRLLRQVLGYAQSPQGRRQVENALGGLRSVSGSGRGRQLLARVDTPQNRDRLGQLLRRGSGRR